MKTVNVDSVERTRAAPSLTLPLPIAPVFMYIILPYAPRAHWNTPPPLSFRVRLRMNGTPVLCNRVLGGIHRHRLPLQLRFLLPPPIP